MRFLLAILGFLLLVAAASAQQQTGPQGMSPKEKAALVEKQAERKATDEAYETAIKRTLDSTQKVDPWATLRTPAQK